MADLPDLPESQITSLRAYAEATLSAIEANPGNLPWMTQDRGLDTGLIALVARGVQTMSAQNQEIFFHRLGEATAQRGALERSSMELLYHVVEALNAAGDHLARPQADAGRDERLLAVPGHLLDDWRTALAIGLMQHFRDVSADAYPLAQNTLIAFARDGAVGWGLNEAYLCEAIDTAQQYYFPGADELPDRMGMIKAVVRRADLDWKSLRAVIIGPDRDPAEPSAEVAASSGSNTAASGDDLNATGNTDSASGYPKDPDGTGAESTGQNPQQKDSIFTDGVLSDASTADRGEPAHGRERGAWPGSKAWHRSGPKNPPGPDPDNLLQLPPNIAAASSLFGPNGAHQNLAAQNTGLPNTSNVTIRQSALAGLSEGVDGLVGGVGGLFAGVGAVLSRFVPRPDLAARRWQERQNQQSLERQYRQGEQFVDRFNERLDLLQRDSRVQETFRAIAEDRQQRQEAIRDGADAHSQNTRHDAYVNAQWQKLLDAQPDLRDSLALLETDAERFPEMVNPALVALESLPGDPRGRQEALLAKLDRAREQSDGLPPSVPGKKSVSERLGNIFAAISRFLARLFGGSRVEVSTRPSTPAPVAASSAPRRTTP